LLTLCPHDGERHPQKQRWSYQVNLDKRVRSDHPLRRINETLELDFVRREVAQFYGTIGNVSEGPVVTGNIISLNSRRFLVEVAELPFCRSVVFHGDDVPRVVFGFSSALMNGAQKGANLGPDFSRMGFEREVARVVEDDFGARIISTEGFRPGREKEGVVLSPYRQRRRPMGAKEFLKPGIKRDVAFVVTDEIELNLGALRTIQ
jgi:hypothetical protein